MKITLIICCKNESRSIASVIRNSKPYVDDIIVIDGHSNDASGKIAKKAGARVYLDHGLGKGDAIQTGIKKANGDIIVFMDADESHQPSDIPKLIKPIITGQADLVIASRGIGGSDELNGEFEPNIRMIGSAIITQIINWRYHARITDSQNGFRAIRTAVAKRLRLQETSYTIEQEMIMKALKRNFRITEIPSHEFKRTYGTSKINLCTIWPRYVISIISNCV